MWHGHNLRKDNYYFAFGQGFIKIFNKKIILIKINSKEL